MNRRLPISVIVLLLVIVLVLLVVIFRREFVGQMLFVADGRNLVKNGSFEGGDPRSTDDEVFVGGPNCKMLCDGSTTIDGWEVSGKGVPHPNRTCTNGKAADAACWVINLPPCSPPQSPPCPNVFGIAPQEGNRFVDLTGFGGRPPAAYGMISQAVPTEVGKTYELTFWIGSSSKFAADGLGIFVEIPEVTSGFFLLAPPPQTASQWPHAPSTFRFKATSQTMTLRFTGAVSQGNGSDYIGIDNVSLQKVCFIVLAELYGCP